MATSRSVFDTLRFAFTGLGLLLLPTGQLVGLGAALLLLTWLVDMRWKEKWMRLRERPFFIAGPLLFLMYLVAMCWTSNQAVGWMKLETKLGLFFLPIILGSTRFDFKQTQRLGFIYLAALFTVGLFMVSRSSWFWFTEHRSTFFYQELTAGVMHPSYLAMHFCTGLLLLFHGVLLQYVPIRPHKLMAIGVALFFTVIIFLLSSKLGILSMVMIFVGYIIYAILRFRRYVVGAVALLTLVGGFFLALQVFPEMAGRLERMKAMFSSSSEPINPAETESSKVRVLIWSAGADVAMQQSFFGQGSGDVQDALNKAYEARGMTGAREKELNAHSQVLQTWLAIGIPGLLLLLVFIIGTAVLGIRLRIGFLVLFSLLFLVNILPESMFEVQAGVLFFSWLNSLILFSIDHRCLLPSRTTELHSTL